MKNLYFKTLIVFRLFFFVSVMQYNEILFSAETKEEELQRFIRFVDSNIQRIDCFRKVCGRVGIWLEYTYNI